MYKSITALLLTVFLFGACDNKQESSVSSTKTPRLLDQDMAKEIQTRKEETMRELDQFDTRLVELVMLINEQYVQEAPVLREKYDGLMAAQAEFLQAKSHYEMERNMFIDKTLDIVSTSTSKDQVKENMEKMIEELRNQSEIYLNAGRKLVATMKDAGVDSPLLDELVMPLEPEDGSEAGAAEMNPEG